MRNKVKALVDSRDISVYEFWQRTGISRTTAYSLYNKPEQYPGRDVMDAICLTFSVQPNDVIECIADN